MACTAEQMVRELKSAKWFLKGGDVPKKYYVRDSNHVSQWNKSCQSNNDKTKLEELK